MNISTIVSDRKREIRNTSGETAIRPQFRDRLKSNFSFVRLIEIEQRTFSVSNWGRSLSISVSKDAGRNGANRSNWDTFEREGEATKYSIERSSVRRIHVRVWDPCAR